MIKELLEQLEQQEKIPLQQGLNAGAEKEDIAEAESLLEVSIPDEVKDLYYTHNGETADSPGVFFGIEFMPLEEVIDEIEFNKEESDAEEFLEYGPNIEPEGAIKSRVYHDKWMPIGSDGGGNFLAVDLDPGENGKFGQIINYGSDEETFYVIAESLSDLLAFIVKSIENDDFTSEGQDFVSWGYGHDMTHLFDQLSQMSLPLKG